jgi:tyrosine-protein kinase Etk/Wzc
MNEYEIENVHKNGILSLPSPNDEISIIDIVAVLLKHKKLIIGITVAFFVLAIIYSLVSFALPPDKNYLPNVYRPTAIMIINDQQSGGLSSMLSSSGLGSLAGLAGVSGGGKSNGQLAVFLTKTNGFQDDIAAKFNLADHYRIKKNIRSGVRKALLKKLIGKFDDKTGTMTLSFEDTDPVFGRDLVNYAVGVLDKRFAVIGGDKNLAKKEQLEQKLADVKVEMTRLEDEIQVFQKKYGVISADTLATEQITTVAKVRSELIMKEMDIKTYSQLSRIEDPVLKRLQTERDNLSKLLDQLEKGFTDYENVMPSQNELPKIALEFGHLKRDLLVQEALYQLLTQQYELTKLSLTGEEPTFQVLELAEAPEMKSGPSRGLIVLVATFAGLFLSVLLAFILNAWENMKSDSEAMGRLKGLTKEKT